MQFGVPMVWREGKDHVTDCYFYMTNLKVINHKNKHHVQYPDVSSAIKPVSHDPDLPIPQPNVTMESSFDSESSDMTDTAECGAYRPEEDDQPVPLAQVELNDLTRDLNLSEESAQLLGSRLREKRLLPPGTTFYWYREREEELIFLFTFDKISLLVYCNIIAGLIEFLGLKYDAMEWRHFIDSCNRTLMAVLLNNGNKFSSIPVRHSVVMKESHKSMELLLSALNYQEHEWLICGDLKAIGIILGLQGGYIKYPCFLCVWDSRADDQYYVRQEWSTRQGLKPGSHNVLSHPLVEPSKILLSSLHINFGLMKNFVKALDREGRGFASIHQQFQQKSMEKIKAGIFDGPQIRELIKDTSFDDAVNPTELSVWLSLQSVIANFLGKHRGSQYRKMVDDLMENFRQIDTCISVKTHFLRSHLDYFLENWGDVREEQGERFHQGISDMEKHYQD